MWKTSKAYYVSFGLICTLVQVLEEQLWIAVGLNIPWSENYEVKSLDFTTGYNFILKRKKAISTISDGFQNLM